MSTNRDSREREIQSAHTVAEKVTYRQAGHAFWFVSGVVRCVGCGLGAKADWKQDYKYKETADRLAKEHGPCARPFNLKERLAEIEVRYNENPKEAEGGEVTLKSIDAKLDRILRLLGRIR
jgi:hypothetical protein